MIPQTQTTPSPVTLRLLYHGDLNEHWPTMVRMVTAYGKYRQQGHMQGMDVLTLSTGDTHIGSAESNPRGLFQERADWGLSNRLQKLMGVTYQLVGNHELDGGVVEFIRGWIPGGPTTLWANLNKIFSAPALAQISQAVSSGQIQTGPQITWGRQGNYGVIGVSPANLQTSELATMDLTQTRQAIQSQIQWLRESNPDLNKIILMSHLGVEADRQLAHELDGVDVIVGASSSQPASAIESGKNWVRSRAGEPVLLLHAGDGQNHFGLADLAFDAQGRITHGQNVLLNPQGFPVDPTAAGLVQQREGPVFPLATLTQSYKHKDNALFDPVLTFTAEATRQLTGADMAFVYNQSARSNLQPGVLSQQDIKRLFPFSDSLSVLSLSGSELLHTFQRMVSAHRSGNLCPNVLHGAGVQLTLDQTTGMLSQAQVWNSALQQWNLLDPHATYTVAVEDHLVTHPDLYPFLAQPHRKMGEFPHTLREVLSWGLVQAGAPHRPISLPTSGWIQTI